MQGKHLGALLLAASLIAAFALAFRDRPERTTAVSAPVEVARSGLSVPIEYYRLDNGLRVVLSRDSSAPVATVGVYYNIGLRIEPRDRTGFAHLFEHMMFQGSANLGKNEFFSLVQGLGGVLNGSTRFDYTNYFQAFPSNALETILWAEADRLRSLDITAENLTNQQGVVKNEVKVNILNRPYGGFGWLDVPQYANENWFNAHNFYGDLEHLDAATLEEVRAFFDTYYAPGNAVLVIAGDFDAGLTKGWINKYFGTIPARDVAALPDISEPRQEAEKRASRIDPLAPRPGLAIAYHVPPRWSPEYFAFGLIDQILLQGADSWLHQEFVQKRGYTDSVWGGINLIGNMFNYNGPMLWTAALIHDTTHDATTLVPAFDALIERLTSEPVDERTLERARTKIRSGLYDVVGSNTRFGLVDLLASFALFDDDPLRINRIDEEFGRVTPELIMQTARDYLRPGNRTVVVLEPGQAGANEESRP